MILTTLAEADAYAAVALGVAEALAWLRAHGADAPEGRHPIVGERVFALVSAYDTGPSTEKQFETHRLHLDVQYVASGAERILHAPAGDLEVAVPYDAEKDIAFYAEPKASSSLLMTAGSVALFLPADAHKPGCMAGARHTVRKIVVKVRLAP